METQSACLNERYHGRAQQKTELGRELRKLEQRLELLYTKTIILDSRPGHAVVDAEAILVKVVKAKEMMGALC